MNSNQSTKPLMILGTSSGAGKSYITTAICRLLANKGFDPIPFKGQNMSNNAWVDKKGREMAYSQAVQSWASGREPIAEMNPILLKPKGNETSEVIHLGESMGTCRAIDYYDEYFESGWKVICESIIKLKKIYPLGRLIIEGAGSPVEVNLQYKDLTNLKIAKHLNADCILVADIERGGVFAQIIGTLALLKNDERSLIKGIVINRFRGNRSLFDTGKEWIEKNTGIKVLGVIPWINELFPAEDSLDLVDRGNKNKYADTKIVIMKLPSISNFSDFDSLESEKTVNLKWVDRISELENPDAIIIPGSKQTFKDIEYLNKSLLANALKNFSKNGGHIFGICGGLQILGEKLIDPIGVENNQPKSMKGLGLLPIETIYESKKKLQQIKIKSFWPGKFDITGFELHQGKSLPLLQYSEDFRPFSSDSSMGWVAKNKYSSTIAGSYLHGIFDNGPWRRNWLNELRAEKNLNKLDYAIDDFSKKRNDSFNFISKEFEKYFDTNSIL